MNIHCTLQFTLTGVLIITTIGFVAGRAIAPLNFSLLKKKIRLKIFLQKYKILDWKSHFGEI